jgi:hypothetical protein
VKLLVAVLGLVLVALTSPAFAQVPCVRHDMVFSCADGTSLAIYDDPFRMGGARSRGGGGSRDGGSDRGPGDWWKDDQHVYGPDGQVCLLHGSHVHCSGITEQ